MRDQIQEGVFNATRIGWLVLFGIGFRLMLGANAIFFLLDCIEFICRMTPASFWFRFLPQRHRISSCFAFREAKFTEVAPPYTTSANLKVALTLISQYSTHSGRHQPPLLFDIQNLHRWRHHISHPPFRNTLHRQWVWYEPCFLWSIKCLCFLTDGAARHMNRPTDSFEFRTENEPSYLTYQQKGQKLSI